MENDPLCFLQVYPTWAKRSPDLAEAFQDWVRRARLYYGEVEAAAAIQGMDQYLEASSLEDRTAVLAELRRLHVMADPHRYSCLVSVHVHGIYNIALSTCFEERPC